MNKKDFIMNYFDLWMFGINYKEKSKLSEKELEWYKFIKENADITEPITENDIKFLKELEKLKKEEINFILEEADNYGCIFVGINGDILGEHGTNFYPMEYNSHGYFEMEWGDYIVIKGSYGRNYYYLEEVLKNN